MRKQEKALMMLTLLLGVLMGALDISIVGPAIPPIAIDYGLGENDLSWIFSIYVLFNIVFINPFTKLSDKLGRRTAYLSAIILFGAGSSLCASSASFEWLLAGRAIQGIGSAGIFPVASAIIGDVIDTNKRGRYLGLLGSMFGLAFIVGPVFAGIMLKSLTWNYLFLINIPISIILLIFALFFIPNFKAENTNGRKFDYAGVALLGLSLSLLTIGMSELGNSYPLSLFSIITSAVLFVFWYNHEKSIEHANFNVALFKNNQVKNALIIGFGAGIFQAAFVFFPKFLVSTFSVTASDAGFMLLPLVSGTALGAPISGRIIDRYGAKPVVIAALIAVGLGFLIQTVGSGIAAFYTGSTLIGFGLAMLVGSSLRYIVLNETDVKDRASAQGIMAISISSGQIIGSSVIGIILQKNAGYQLVFGLISAAAFILLIFGKNLTGSRISGK